LVHPISPAKDYRAVRECASLIRSLGPDLVHVHTSKAGVIGRAAAWLADTPSVFTAHTWCFAEGTSWKWKLVGVPCERFAGWMSSAIVNVSDANRNLALEHRIGHPDRVLRIWNGISDTEHRARPGMPGPPKITMVARFASQKDHALLLQAVSSIDQPLEVLFVGDGPTCPPLRAEAERLGISDRVRFLGERKDVAEILAASHIFALPTKWEGFPLSILEGMRAGLPVLASDVGGIAEAVVDGETGFLAPAGDLPAFRARLLSLVESPAVRRRMGEAGRARYEEHFTAQVMLRQTLEVYRRAVSERPSRGRRGPAPALHPGRSFAAQSELTSTWEGKRS